LLLIIYIINTNPATIMSMGKRSNSILSNSQIPPRTKSNPAITQNPSTLKLKYFLAVCDPSVMIPTPIKPITKPKSARSAIPIQIEK
jgi:hypothetical protein